MNILVAHNSYQQRGGEDSVADAEIDLLRSRGHHVVEYRRHNDELRDIAAMTALADMLWSRRTTADFATLLKEFRPDVVHVHNTFPLISPSLYWAAERAAIPIVQTLHNFRLLCPQAMLLRDGRICEDCVGKVPLPAVLHGCYRNSRAQSAGITGMLTLHRALGTWSHKVSRYIALNEFCKRKFVAGGLPAQRIVIKPNFVDFAPMPESERADFLFVGRLAADKGVAILAEAARRLPGTSFRVAGEGPDAGVLEGIAGVSRLGALSGDGVRQAMGRAIALIMPSIWYENFPRTLVEAFACGLPVIASRLGALAELVEDGQTGLLFNPGDADDLAEKLRWATANPAAMSDMGKRARQHYDDNFTAERNYQVLMKIYGSVVSKPG